VFGNEVGQRVGSIKVAWQAACRRAGVVDLHFHDLRREAGSRWMEAGVPLATIQRWLGHTNISQTSVYLTTTTVGEHNAMRQFEERLGRLIPIDTEVGRGHHQGPPSAATREKKPAKSGILTDRPSVSRFS
jgi:integrase